MEPKEELKIKARIEKPEKIEVELKKIGKYNGKESTIDYFFKNKNLSEEHEFRLRKYKKNKLITFKIQKALNQVQENLEFSFQIDNPENFVQFIEILGFNLSSSLKKSSKIYQKKEISIRISEIETLGYFIEITSEVTNKPKEKYKEKMLKILNQLNIDENSIDNRFYDTIKQDYENLLEKTA